MNKIIEVHNLIKSYGSIQAVKGINFYVEQGSLFAFLGENGAGKSTTIDMLCTLLKADAGNVIIDNKILGKEDDKIRSIIGIVFQDAFLDNLLTVEENLEIRGSFYGLKKKQIQQSIKNVTEITDSQDIIHRKYGKLSGGQKRRADIARALINKPKILFLDEPTTGLDPKTRKLIWKTIENLRKQTGMTVFLTTHYMEEAARADFITVMGKGKILAKGTPIELKQKYAKDLLKLKPKDKNSLCEKLKSIDADFDFLREAFVIKMHNTIDALEIAERFKEDILNVEIVNGTMDDVFLNIANTY